MNLEEFVLKTTKLLQKEREAELEETNLVVENTPLKELQRRGICLLKLRISERKTGLYGRTVLVFSPYWEGKELPSHNFTPGDIAGIGLSQGQAQEHLVSGIVSRASPGSISIAIEEGQDEALEGLEDTAHYKLVKLANDVTYKRLKKGLENLNHYSQGAASTMINVLFGVSEPGSPLSRARDATLLNNIAFFNEGLDATQKEAVKFALHQRELAIVHGPPGTGKTTTVVEIIRQAVLRDLKVLACAPSNIAVDNLVERLGDCGTKIVRLGHPARLLPKIQKYSLDALLSNSEERQLVKDVRSDIDKTLTRLKKTRNFGEKSALRGEMKSLRKELREREEAATRGILKRSQVVLSTLTGISNEGPLKLLDDKHFDVVVIDECSQALEAACWLALLKAPRCILAGDHNQLPPTIMSQAAAKDGLEITLMERLIKKYGDKVMRMLTVQYRMHEKIMEWPSLKLYNGKLSAHASVASHVLSDMEEVKQTEDTLIPLLLIDTVGCGLHELNLPSQVSKANEGEADLVSHHVEKLVESGLKPIDIAVIAPYNLQVELLRIRLSEKYPALEIKSVDGFQGREKEAVIMCMVRSNAEGEVGFLAEERRTNVAVTRARRHLTVICDTETIGSNEFLQSLVDFIMENGEVRSAQQYIDEGALNNNYSRPEFLDEKIEAASTASEERVKTKIKRVEKKRQPINNKNEKNQDARNRKNKDDKMMDGKRHKFRPPKSEKELEEEAEEEKELRVIFVDFIEDSSRTTHDFPQTLSSRQRFIAHTIAEEYGLKHDSKGEGDNRFINISKQEQNKPDSKVCTSSSKANTIPSKDVQQVQNNEEIESNLSCSSSNSSQSPRLKFSQDKKQESKDHVNIQDDHQNQIERPTTQADGNLLGIGTVTISSKSKPVDCIPFSRCSYCEKDVPTSNIDLHEIRCQKKIGNEMDARPKSASIEEKNRPNTGNSKNATKKKKKKEKKTAQESEDDFDALIAEATKMNTICNFTKCKEYTTVLGQNCAYCARRFCLTHHVPEQHGCGNAAKSHARTVISKEGVLYRGSGVPDKAMDPKKKAFLQRKLDKKLTDMSDSRKLKKK